MSQTPANQAIIDGQLAQLDDIAENLHDAFNALPIPEFQRKLDLNQAQLKKNEDARRKLETLKEKRDQKLEELTMLRSKMQTISDRNEDSQATIDTLTVLRRDKPQIPDWMGEVSGEMFRMFMGGSLDEIRQENPQWKASLLNEEASDLIDQYKKQLQQAQKATSKAEEDARKAKKDAKQAEEEARKAEEDAEKAKEDARKARHTLKAENKKLSGALAEAETKQKKAEAEAASSTTAMDNLKKRLQASVDTAESKQGVAEAKASSSAAALTTYKQQTQKGMQDALQRQKQAEESKKLADQAAATAKTKQNAAEDEKKKHVDAYDALKEKTAKEVREAKDAKTNAETRQAEAVAQAQKDAAALATLRTSSSKEIQEAEKKQREAEKRESDVRVQAAMDRQAGKKSLKTIRNIIHAIAPDITDPAEAEIVKLASESLQDLKISGNQAPFFWSIYEPLDGGVPAQKPEGSQLLQLAIRLYMEVVGKQTWNFHLVIEIGMKIAASVDVLSFAILLAAAQKAADERRHRMSFREALWMLSLFQITEQLASRLSSEPFNAGKIALRLKTSIKRSNVEVSELLEVVSAADDAEALEALESRILMHNNTTLLSNTRSKWIFWFDTKSTARVQAISKDLVRFEPTRCTLTSYAISVNSTKLKFRFPSLEAQEWWKKFVADEVALSEDTEKLLQRLCNGYSGMDDID